MAAKRNQTRLMKKRSRRAKTAKSDHDLLSRFKAQAREIAEARQAMRRVTRGIEFVPERLHYVTDLHLL